jgi:hypothetical protein
LEGGKANTVCRLIFSAEVLCPSLLVPLGWAVSLEKNPKIGWSLEEEAFTQFQTENMHNNKNIERGDRRLGNAVTA